MTRYVIVVVGVFGLALNQCVSQYTNCTGNFDWLHDGFCNSDTNNLACGYDGGDCCACTCMDGPWHACGSNGFRCLDPACPDEDPPPYPNCAGNFDRLNDGLCDSDTNNLACGYDGGDCCACTCMDGPSYPCGSNGFSCGDTACLDPDIAVEYPECAGNWLSIGDGLCTAENNNLSCGYDGGDCCLCTCSGRACVYSDFDCLDPSAGDEIYDCKPQPPTSLPCPADGQRVWVVEDSAQARALAEAVNCSGGSFEVLWTGEVVVDTTIYVSGGTVVNMTGSGSIASMDGNSATRLLTVVNASVHVTGVNMSYGTSIVGGAIAAVRSSVTFSSSTFFGNSATGHGGAIYASDGSVVSFIESISLSHNTVAMDGGAVFILDSVCTGEDVTFFNNTAGGDGGAMMITEHSSLSWSGKATYRSNSAVGSAGGLALQSGSSASWYGKTVFDRNTAVQRAGALHVLDYSHVAWNATNTFSNNQASSSGGAMRVTSSSSISWSGITKFEDNSGLLGGAMAISGESMVSAGGHTTFSANTAEGWGGAVVVSNYSIVAWDGETTFSRNLAGQGGAVYAISNSDLSFDGRTTFRGNIALDVNRSDVPQQVGGALVLFDATVAFIGNTTFSANKAEGLGGAVFVKDCSIVKWDGETTFSSNLAGDGGAVFAISNFGLSFDGKTAFHENLALHGNKFEFLQSGGALTVYDSSVTLSGETMFANNQASYAGGAVVIFNTTAKWTGRSSFHSNAGGKFGGALYLADSSVVFDGNTTFQDNTACVGGAVIAVDSCVSWDGDMEFVNNTASSGGALSASNSSVLWSGKAILAHNQANDGGALWMFDSNASWSGECTFLNNSGNATGGALVSTSSSVVFGGNTTFHGNAALLGGAVDASMSSSISWDGDVEFSNNVARAGGALIVTESCVSWSGNTTLANNRAYRGYGGALWAFNSSTVSWSGKSTFNNNSAWASGGAIALSWDSNTSWSGSATFLSCDASFGGALFVTNGSAMGWSGRTEFTSNTARFSGGAIRSDFPDEEHNRRTSILFINGSTRFANNTAGSAGGGMELNGILHVKFQSRDVLFIGNSAEAVGGAVSVSSFGIGPVFSGVRFVANSARAGGGAYVTSSGNVYLVDFEATPVYPTKFDGCQFVDNWATETGGAIETASSQDRISNTSFMGNTAGVGGALRLGGKTFLDNCSFVDNRSGEGEGPAVDNVGYVGRIVHSSFVGNVFNCDPGKYLEFNESDNVFEVACNGCGALCQGCTFEEPSVVPVCTQAMQHVTSSGGASTLETVSINRGFWRATSTSEEVLACYREDACLGGVTGTPDYCLHGYEGPYCSVCTDGYATGFGFVCDKCSDKAGGIVLVIVIAVIGLLGAAAIASYTTSSQLEGYDRGTIERVTRFIPLQSIKIVIVALQIVTQFTAIANVTYPHVYQRFLDTVNVLNFDLGWVSQLSVGCLLDIGIHGRLLIATIGPIIVALFLGVTYVVAANANRGSAEALGLIWHKCVSIVLLLTFLVYASVSSILFQMFACDDLEDGKKYLRADYRVECDSSKHNAFQIYAGFMIVLYTVGIPSLYSSLLFRDRGVLKDEVGREENQRTKSFSDLWKPYKPSIFYYEVIECGRRVLLTGAVVFIYPNTSAQIAVTLMIAFVFAMMSEGLAPFASKWDTWINRMGHVVVYVSMYVALLLKVDVSNERSSSQKVFEAVLVAAHLGMILAVIIETVVMVCSLREKVREGTSPKFRGTKLPLSGAVPNAGRAISPPRARIAPDRHFVH